MDDLTAAWTAWTATLAAAGFDVGPHLNPPADAAAVAAAQESSGVRFPAELAALYALADGQGPSPEDPQVFPHHRFLPVAEARTAWGGWDDVLRHDGAGDTADEHVTVRAGDPVRRAYWHAGWWPLAEDGGGNVLVVDTDPAPGGTVGQVVVAGPDEDERRVLAPGLAAYLRALAAADLESEEVGDDVVWWDTPGLR